MAGGYVTPNEFASQWAAQARPKYRKYAVLMGQLVKRESGGKLRSRNDGLNRNGTVDHGPLQVNDIWRRDPVVGPLFQSGAIYTVDGAIKAGQRILDVQGLNAWSTHNPATDAKYIGAQAPVGANVPRRHTGLPGLSTAPAASTSLPGFDQAGFDQARKRSILGGLLASRHGTNSILFKTGLLTTSAPNASDFVKPGMQQAAVAASVPATGQKANSPITTPGSTSDDLRVLIERANKIDTKHFNYEWGGGHNTGGTPTHGVGHGSGPGIGFDCSGAVSKVLGINPLVASQFESWGKPGKGKQVTIYAKSTHVLVEIGGHFFGTSGANPGGGAGWIPRGALSASYLAGFVARHPAGM